MPVRILIVDDHEVVREGIRTIIHRSRPHWEICGEASSGENAIDMAMREKPDVIVMDISMPGINGFEATGKISQMGLGSRVLMFTMHESNQLERDVRKVGANGYVYKSRAARDLILAIETLLSGQTFFGRARKAESTEEPPSSSNSFCLAARWVFAN